MNSKILGLLTVGLIAAPISTNAQSTTYTFQGAAFTGGTYDVNPPAGFTSVFVPPNFGLAPLNAADDLHSGLQGCSPCRCHFVMPTPKAGARYHESVARRRGPLKGTTSPTSLGDRFA